MPFSKEWVNAGTGKAPSTWAEIDGPGVVKIGSKENLKVKKERGVFKTPQRIQLTLSVLSPWRLEI